MLSSAVNETTDALRQVYPLQERVAGRPQVRSIVGSDSHLELIAAAGDSYVSTGNVFLTHGGAEHCRMRTLDDDRGRMHYRALSFLATVPRSL